MGFSSGNVLFDASLPVANVHAEVEVLGLGYVRTLGILGRSAKFDAQNSGDLVAIHRPRGRRNEDTDPHTAWRIRGSACRSTCSDHRRWHCPEFAKYQQHTILGVSLQVAPPLWRIRSGSVHQSRGTSMVVSTRDRCFICARAVDLGGCRRRLALHRRYAYVGSTTLTQSALSFAKASAIWTFGRSLWLAASYGRATGGQTRVEGAVTNSVQRDNRLGATLVVPVHKSAAIRVIYTSGLSRGRGPISTRLRLAVSTTWFKRRAPAPTVDRASLAASPGWRDIP